MVHAGKTVLKSAEPTQFRWEVKQSAGNLHLTAALRHCRAPTSTAGAAEVISSSSDSLGLRLNFRSSSHLLDVYCVLIASRKNDAVCTNLALGKEIFP